MIGDSLEEPPNVEQRNGHIESKGVLLRGDGPEELNSQVVGAVVLQRCLKR